MLLGLLLAAPWAHAETIPAAPPGAPPALEAPIPPLTPPAPTGVVVDRVAAVVNEDIITLAEVYEFGGSFIEERVTAVGEGARAASEGQVIERLLERRLVEQEMRALKLDLTEQEIDRSLAEIAERNGLDTDGLRREIEKSGLRWDQYRAELRESLRDMKFAQSVLRPRVTITPDELRDAWLRTSPSAGSTSRVQALVLAVPPGASDAEREAVLARARELRELANAGGDFAALSREFDQGPFGAQSGEMGSFKAGELVGPLDAVVASGVVGQVAEPIVIGDGVYLLRVAERTAAANDFESRKAELSEQVFESRLADEQQRWFQEARRRAAIRIVLPGIPQPGSTPAR
jgi:peptidyl-prolyl cis-trans isomerase SurA